MNTQNQTIQAIAAKHLRVKTLATQKSDSLDFHELAVWSINAALNAAYEAGKQQISGEVDVNQLSKDTQAN